MSIVGPSGCGKTTFLNAVDGLVRIGAGDIRVDGKRVDRPGPDRAMVFQHDCLFPWRTVEANITYGLELQGKLSRRESASAPARSSISSGSRASPITTRMSCRAACASASTSPARW